MVQRIVQGVERFPFAVVALALVTVVVTGCNSGGRSSNGTEIPGVSNAAAPLPQDNFSYIGPPLETNRYFHTATTLEDGKVVVIGGSDENSFTSLDSVEVFDQSLFDNPPPESISGDFVDTNFVGDPITLINGGRLYHTSTLLNDGTVIVIGGTFDILISLAIPQAEIFDAQVREFNPGGLEPTNEMVTPRFRHTASLLANGKVLISGGQESVDETIIDPNFPPGSPFFQFDITVFPSTKDLEVYDVASRTFSRATDIASSTSELQTPRGRAEHVSVSLAGFDNLLGTGDDVVLFGSGFQTLSGVFAPDLKFPGAFGSSNQSSVEFYDLSTGITSTAPGVNIAPRLNGGDAINLGLFTNETPDGVLGVANVAAFLNGDNSGPNCSTTVDPTEILAATFSGFGPASGIQFFENSAAFGICGGRSFGAPVMALDIRDYDGVPFVGNWVINTGGLTIFPPPTGGCVQDPSCQVQFSYLDPFFFPVDLVDLDGDGTNPELLVDITRPEDGGTDALFGLEIEDVPVPWDMTRNRTVQNPTGVMSFYIFSTGTNPNDDPLGVQFGLPPGLGISNDFRLMHTANMVPGVDGVLNTPDDRVLLVGGGSEFYGQWGGEPVSNGSEIFLPLEANE